MRFYLPFLRLGIFGRGVEDNVPAGDEGFDVGKVEFLKKFFQPLHFDRMPTDVYGAQKGNELGHGGIWRLLLKSAEEQADTQNKGGYR